MRPRQGRSTNDQAGVRAVELLPDFSTIGVCVVENLNTIEMFTKYFNTHSTYVKTSTRDVRLN